MSSLLEAIHEIVGALNVELSDHVGCAPAVMLEARAVDRESVQVALTPTTVLVGAEEEDELGPLTALLASLRLVRRDVLVLENAIAVRRDDLEQERRVLLSNDIDYSYVDEPDPRLAETALLEDLVHRRRLHPDYDYESSESVPEGAGWVQVRPGDELDKRRLWRRPKSRREEQR